MTPKICTALALVVYGVCLGCQEPAGEALRPTSSQPTSPRAGRKSDQPRGPACNGSGWYCGDDLGGATDHLYYCTGTGAASFDLGPCPGGACVIEQQADVPDHCEGGQARVDGLRNPGGGWWCGGPGTNYVDGQADHLYYFGNGHATDLGLCPSGCYVNPAQDQPDACRAADGGVPVLPIQSTLYPAPRYVSSGALLASVQRACVDTRALASHLTLDRLVPGLIQEAGLQVGDPAGSCDYRLHFEATTPPLDSAAQGVWTAAGTNDERYLVVTTLEGDRPSSLLVATSERGALYAVRAALSVLQADPGDPARRQVPGVTLVDYPEFVRRGVVEGFYGTPYSISDRTTIIRLMGRLRENTFIYSPKGDLKTRNQWRVAYTQYESQTIATAAHEADANLITFFYGISPGLDYHFTAGDYAALKNKIESVRALGVRQFAVFWDDISGNLSADEGRQHAQVMNQLDDDLRSRDPAARLITVGDDYRGAGTPYSDGLGALLHPGVEVLWTGNNNANNVEPDTMSPHDLDDPNRHLRRKVGIWDNWPVRDDQFSGRTGDLWKNVSGFYSNPVLNELSAHPTRSFLQVLGPIADYLWYPERYVGSPQSSYSRWQPILGGMQRVVAPCTPVGGITGGWTCQPGNPDAIYFCDSDPSRACAGCVTALPCPGGCQSQRVGLPDLCH
jgi:hypothetical protein